MLIFNLQTLFAVSLHTTSNSIAVNTLISVAMVQSVTSLIYQKSMHGKETKVVLIALFAKWKLSKYVSHCRKSHTVVTQLDSQLLNPVPEVAYNYKEFQEPLIGYN